MTPSRATCGSALSIGLLYLVLFNITALPSALALFAVSGVPGIAYSVGVQTLLQHRVDDRYRGRVFGAFGANNALLLITGAGLGGICGAVVGVRSMLVASGALYLVAAMAAVQLVRQDDEPVSHDHPADMEPTEQPVVDL